MPKPVYPLGDFLDNERFDGGYTKVEVDAMLAKMAGDVAAPYGVAYNHLVDTYSVVGHGIPVVQATMRRCVVDAGGKFLYYLDPNDSTKKENGEDATADIEGKNGTRQVKVQISKFYQKRFNDGTLDVHLISLDRFPGAEVHPIFRQLGWREDSALSHLQENDYAYVGAFEGVLFDASANAFLDNNKANDNTGNIDLANDKIMSIAGKKPYSGITIVEGRTLIANGGSKQYSYHMWDAINLLYFTEYRDYNSQNKIPGYTSGGNIDRIAKTGLTLSLGNKSGSIVNSAGQVAGASATTTVANSYRGIENFFGHLWRFTDGINIQDGKPFVCGIADEFLSNKFDGQYAQVKDSNGLNIQMPQAHGYETQHHAGTFLTKTNTGGNSISKVCDHYWYSAGNRVLLSSGYLNYGGSVGAFCWYGDYSSGGSGWYIAVRS